MVSIKIPKKRKEKEFQTFLDNHKKIQASRCSVQLSIWTDGVGILNMNT